MNDTDLINNLKSKIKDAKKTFTHLKKYVFFDKYSPSMMLYLAQWSENPKAIQVLACHPDDSIREAITHNPFTSYETLLYLLTDKNKDIIRTVLSFGKLEQEDFHVLSVKFSKDVNYYKKNEDTSRYLQLLKPTSKYQWANSQSICLLHNHHVGLKAMENIDIKSFEPFHGDDLNKLLQVKDNRIEEIKHNKHVSLRITPTDCMHTVQRDNYKKYIVKEWRVKNKAHETIFNDAENHLLDYFIEAEQKAFSSEDNLVKNKKIGRQDSERLFNSTDKKTFQSWLGKVKRDGLRLSKVPKKFKTYKLCLASVKQDGSALQYVPESMMTLEICFEAIKNNGASLEFVPPELTNLEMYESAVGQQGEALRFVPENFKNESLCFKAVLSNGWALIHIPRQLINKKLCNAAVSRNGYVIKAVPIEFLSEDLCLVAIRSEPSALRYIPESHKTEAVCVETVRKNAMLFSLIPDKFLNEELIMDIVENHRGNLKYILEAIPENKQTEKIGIAAVNQAGQNLEFISKSLQTESMCLTAVSKYGPSLQYVSKRTLSESICFAAVKKWAGAIKYVPEKFQSVELCLLASKTTHFPWEVREYISKTYLTKHPFILSKCTKDKYPSNSIFEQSMEAWVEDNSISEEDIKSCLNNAPTRLRKTQNWNKWALMFSLD